MTASRKVVVTGECMIELSQKSADVQRGFGGDMLNASVYIARQADAAALPIHYVTALSTDDFSQQMLGFWQGENVSTLLTQRMENRLSGLYHIETDSTSERTFYYWRNEAAAKFWLESEQSAAIYEELAMFDYLHLSGISLVILSSASRDKLLLLLCECRVSGGKVIFDNNYRLRLWSSKEETRQVHQQMLERTNIAFLTLNDEDILWGEKPIAEVIARTYAADVQEVAAKHGADSCPASTAGEELVDVPAVKLPKERVIDTTAAGDSFSAGYLTVCLTGGDAAEAAKRGHLAVSTVIQHRGAIIPRDAMPQ